MHAADVKLRPQHEFNSYATPSPQMLSLYDQEAHARQQVDERLSLTQRFIGIPTSAMEDKYLLQHTEAGSSDTPSLAIRAPFGGSEVVRDGLRVEAMPKDQFIDKIAQHEGIDAKLLTSDQPVTFAHMTDILYAVYRSVTIPDLQCLMQRCDAAFNMLSKDIFEMRAEIRDMGQESRQWQSEKARLCAVIGGWPNNTPPHIRCEVIFELLDIDVIKNHVYKHHYGDPWKYPYILKKVLTTWPVTIWFNGRWSPVSSGVR